MKTTERDMMRPVGRLRGTGARTSLYALALSLALHALATLGFRVRGSEAGQWPFVRPFVWMIEAREPGGDAAPVVQTRAPFLHGASPAPRFVPDTQASLDAVAGWPVSRAPVLMLSTTVDSREPLTASTPPVRQWRWRIVAEGAVPKPVAEAIVKLGRTVLDAVRPVAQPAVFACTVIEPGSLRSAALIESSGDGAFDQSARATLLTLQFDNNAGMASPHTVSRFRAAVSLESSQ